MLERHDMKYQILMSEIHISPTCPYKIWTLNEDIGHHMLKKVAAIVGQNKFNCKFFMSSSREK